MNKEITYRPSQVPAVLVEILSGMEDVQDVVLSSSKDNKIIFRCNNLQRSIEVAPSRDPAITSSKFRSVQWYASDLVLLLNSSARFKRTYLLQEIIRVIDVWLDGDMRELFENYIAHSVPFMKIELNSERYFSELYIKDRDSEFNLGEFVVKAAYISHARLRDEKTGWDLVVRSHIDDRHVVYYVDASPRALIEYQDWARVVIQKIIRLEYELRETLNTHENNDNDETNEELC